MKLAQVLDLFGEPEPAAPPPAAPSPAPLPVAPPQPAPPPPWPAAPGARTAAEVRAVVAAIAPEFRRVVFTTNRRVMASVAGGGSTLRLNAAFASAPDEILTAVAGLFCVTDEALRREARAHVRRFLEQATGAAPAATAPLPDPAPAPRPGSRSSGRGERTAAEVRAVIAEVAPAFRRVVFTRNRRVMVSSAERGTTLRLNAAFASAPRPVLAAIGRMFAARDPRTRRGAREAVVRFVRKHVPPAGASGPRVRRPRPGDAAIVARLRAEFDRVNTAHFDGSLPSPPIHLSGRMRRRNGHFCANPMEIVISRRLCTHAVDGEAERTLRHEMIHLWQHASGHRPGHGRDFREWARRLDVHPRATRPVVWKD